MTPLEITLLIVGVVFLLGSFFVPDKLSGKDIEKIGELSEHEINVILEKRLGEADTRISGRVDELTDEVSVNTKRSMERTANEKIMAINEYSDTVLASINKSHEEIMFLYSMLNDKHTELTELAGSLSEFSAGLRRTENELLERLATSAEQIREQVAEQSEVVEPQEILEASVAQAAALEEPDDGNHNGEILALHRAGRSAVEIAKELGLGLGEVRLVIDLYRGAAV